MERKLAYVKSLRWPKAIQNANGSINPIQPRGDIVKAHVPNR